VADAAYDYAHQQRRDQLIPHAYGTPCPRCGEPMLRGQELDLGHSTDVVVDPNGIGDRIEHADCNRSAGAKAQAERRKFDRSREW
jgi:hypothetical protein